MSVALDVLHMLRVRVPHLSWGAARVVWAVRDYEHVIDVTATAQRCADWLAGPDAQRVRDGPAQLRRYFEQERVRSAPNVTTLQRSLEAYSRPDVQARPSTASPPSPRNRPSA